MQRIEGYIDNIKLLFDRTYHWQAKTRLLDNDDIDLTLFSVYLHVIVPQRRLAH